ncbi:MAG: hypothetical protein KAQ85_11575, partial [Thermodesulfovibrionia bacterium]|nr:hypothetical protein [Thermodesulfovibrionia bacterium]
HSLWNTNIKIPYGFKSWGESLNATREHYINKVQGKTAVDIRNEKTGRLITDISQVGVEDLPYLSNKQKNLYWQWLMATNDDVFYAVLKKTWPETPLEDLIRETKRQRKKAIDVATKNHSSIGSAMLNDVFNGDEEAFRAYSMSGGLAELEDTKKIAYFKGMSRFLRWTIETAPLYNYIGAKPKASGKRIDFAIINNQLLVAANHAKYMSVDQAEAELWTEEERIDYNLLRQAENAGEGTAVYDNIMSFRRAFLQGAPERYAGEEAGKSPIEKTNDYSYKYLSQNTENIIDAFPDIDSDLIKQKAQVAQDLISAFYTHYKSASVRNAGRSSITTNSKGLPNIYFKTQTPYVEQMDM